jgi:CHAD domain-containing protein
MGQSVVGVGTPTCDAPVVHRPFIREACPDGFSQAAVGYGTGMSTRTDDHPRTDDHTRTGDHPRAGRDRGRSALLLRYVVAQRDAIRSAEPGVRAGDAEAIHDMRVAARRLRSTLRTFRPLFDRARTEPLRAELRWLGRLLGNARDGDVLAERLSAAIRAEPPELVVGPVAARIRRRLAEDTAPARRRLVTGLDGDRFAGLVAALDQLAGGAAGPARAGPGRLRRRARRALRRADRLLDAASTAPAPRVAAEPGITADRDTRLHEARKAYKRARYAVEAVAALADGPARRLVKRLKAIQNVLGEHQDTIVARQALRAQGMRAFGDGENAFTYGLLHGRQRAVGAEALAGLDKATRRAGKGKLRRWLT